MKAIYSFIIMFIIFVSFTIAQNLDELDLAILTRDNVENLRLVKTISTYPSTYGLSLYGTLRFFDESQDLMIIYYTDFDSSDYQSTCYRWRISTGQPDNIMQNYPTEVTCGDSSRAGKFRVIFDQSLPTFEIFSTADNRLVYQMWGLRYDFSYDDKLLAYLEDDKIVVVETTTWQVIQEFPAEFFIESLVFCPDSTCLLAKPESGEGYVTLIPLDERLRDKTTIMYREQGSLDYMIGGNPLFNAKPLFTPNGDYLLILETKYSYIINMQSETVLYSCVSSFPKGCCDMNLKLFTTAFNQGNVPICDKENLNNTNEFPNGSIFSPDLTMYVLCDSSLSSCNLYDAYSHEVLLTNLLFESVDVIFTDTYIAGLDKKGNFNFYGVVN